MEQEKSIEVKEKTQRIIGFRNQVLQNYLTFKYAEASGTNKLTWIITFEFLTLVNT